MAVANDPSQVALTVRDVPPTKQEPAANRCCCSFQLCGRVSCKPLVDFPMIAGEIITGLATAVTAYTGSPALIPITFAVSCGLLAYAHGAMRYFGFSAAVDRFGQFQKGFDQTEKREEAAVDTLQTQVTQISETVQKQVQEIEDLKEQNEKLDAEKADLDALVAKLKGLNENIQKNTEAQRAEIDRLEAALKQQDGAIQMIEQQNALFKSEVESLGPSLARVNQDDPIDRRSTGSMDKSIE